MGRLAGLVRFSCFVARLTLQSKSSHPATSDSEHPDLCQQCVSVVRYA